MESPRLTNQPTDLYQSPAVVALNSIAYNIPSTHVFGGAARLVQYVLDTDEFKELNQDKIDEIMWYAFQDLNPETIIELGKEVVSHFEHSIEIIKLAVTNRFLPYLETFKNEIMQTLAAHPDSVYILFDCLYLEQVWRKDLEDTYSRNDIIKWLIANTNMHLN